MAQINTHYKDRLFAALFGSSDRKELTLELYNALNDTHYTNPEDIQINTLGDVVYMGMKNDVSFLLANDLNMYEQQSTGNPNMPTRCLLYALHALERYLHESQKYKKLYGPKLVSLPAPKLVVLYNIDEKRCGVPVCDQDMRFSDCFIDHKKGDIEAVVHVYNVNLGNRLPDKCPSLYDYSLFVDGFRTYSQNAETEEDRLRAADAALRRLPDGPVKRYISSQKSEVISMLLTEFNEAEILDSIREDYKEEGRAEGKEEGKAEERARTQEIFSKLSEAMTAHGCSMNEFSRVMADESFRKKMMKKFSIS